MCVPIVSKIFSSSTLIHQMALSVQCTSYEQQPSIKSAQDSDPCSTKPCMTTLTKSLLSVLSNAPKQSILLRPLRLSNMVTHFCFHCHRAETGSSQCHLSVLPSVVAQEASSIVFVDASLCHSPSYRTSSILQGLKEHLIAAVSQLWMGTYDFFVLCLNSIDISHGNQNAYI